MAGRTVTQLVLTLPGADGEFTDPTLGLAFHGRYAVITLDARDAVDSLTIGDGRRLRFRGHALTTSSAAYAGLGGPTPTLTARAPSLLSMPDGRRVPATAP